jgi:RHS repeat-associated protein
MDDVDRWPEGYSVYVAATFEIREALLEDDQSFDGIEARYLWNEAGILFELDSATPEGAPMPQRRLTLTNQIGSAATVLNADAGVEAAIQSQLAYGAEEQSYPRVRLVAQVAVATRYEFAGKERDKGVGLLHFGARALDGRLARWTSVDPLGTTAPQRAATFDYARGSPARFVDVDGRDYQDVVVVLVTGGRPHLATRWHTDDRDRFVRFPMSEETTIAAAEVGRRIRASGAEPLFVFANTDSAAATAFDQLARMKVDIQGFVRLGPGHERAGPVAAEGSDTAVIGQNALRELGELKQRGRLTEDVFYLDLGCYGGNASNTTTNAIAALGIAAGGPNMRINYDVGRSPSGRVAGVRFLKGDRALSDFLFRLPTGEVSGSLPAASARNLPTSFESAFSEDELRQADPFTSADQPVAMRAPAEPVTVTLPDGPHYLDLRPRNDAGQPLGTPSVPPTRKPPGGSDGGPKHP